MNFLNKTKMSTKSEVASILNIPTTYDWSIMDTYPEHDLVLVHYTYNGDMNNFGHLKGVIVDTKEKKVVCQSFGYAHTVTSNHLKVIKGSANGKVPDKFLFKDDSGSRIDMKVADVKITKGYDGAIIRVFKHRGKVFTSTHKKIISDKSSWGNSLSFSDMYRELLGPTEELFSPSEESSPFTYIFMMAHPCLQIASRMTSPKLFYLGYNGEGTPSVFPATTPAEVLTVEEAEDFLQNGYGPHVETTNSFLSHGEFVMLISDQRCVKVQSDAYRWRTEMRDSDPNIEHLVFQLAALKPRNLKIRSEYYEFSNRYPLLAWPDDVIMKLPYEVPILLKDMDVINNYNSQRMVILACLLYATPPEKQWIVVEAVKSYFDFLMKAYEWIIELSVEPEKIREIKDPVIRKRFRNIIAVAKKNAFQHPEEDQKVQFEANVANFVAKEYGDTCYRMYTYHQDKDYELVEE